MILAAGFGKRMGSLSKIRPKPLTPILGKTLLERIIGKIQQVKKDQIIVNGHHLGAQIKDHLTVYRHADPPDVHYLYEKHLLETGGGVKNALPYFTSGSILVVNSDGLWFDDDEQPALKALLKAFDEQKHDALLAVTPLNQATGYDGQGDFFMDAGFLQFQDDEHAIQNDQKAERNQTIKNYASKEKPNIRGRHDIEKIGKKRESYVFTGIMIIKTDLYSQESLPKTAFSNSLIFRQLAAKGRLGGFVFPAKWVHVGTPDAIGLAEDICKDYE